MAEIESKNQDQGLIWLIAGGAVFVASLLSFYTIEQTAFIRTLIVLLGFIIGAFLVYQADTGKKIVHFFLETKIELKKVFWPTRPETIKMTITVIIGVVIIALFLWLVDSILLWLVKKFI